MMECPQCHRKVEQLTEALICEGESRIQIIRCDDCWTVAREILQNAKNN